jgi:hypothetical protein
LQGSASLCGAIALQHQLQQLQELLRDPDQQASQRLQQQLARVVGAARRLLSVDYQDAT